MPTISRRREKWLLYRNTAIVFLFSIVVIGLGLRGPITWGKLIWLVPLIYIAYQLWLAHSAVHPRRIFSALGLTPAAANLPFNEVILTSRDGLRLAGWFIPGHLRAAILLVHGLNGSSSSMIYHAAALASYGFKVLLFDLRGHGSSQGDLCTGGIQEANDVLGAVDYLLSREDVDADKIGALGISLGAQCVLRGAVEGENIRAVVLEGLGSMSLKDHGNPPMTLLRRMYTPINWIYYKLYDFMSGVSNPESTTSALRRFGRPVLLITTGTGLEHKFGRVFSKAIGDLVTLWEIPKARHAAGYFYDVKAYQKKVVNFFKQTLNVMEEPINVQELRDHPS
ncbi:MAG: alpha/beta fold hydrolase [Anaerolineales bacterium]|nr:alpha/beta fold hydrolase [Anaerolineales bacterium]